MGLGRKWGCCDSCDLSSLPFPPLSSHWSARLSAHILGMDAALILLRGLPSHAHNVGASLTLPALTWVREQSAEVSRVPGK